MRGHWLVGVLGLWAFAPIGQLLLRTLTPSWRYPQLLPDTTGAWTALSTTASARLAPAVATSLWLALMTGAAATGIGFLVARATGRAGGSVRRLTMAAALLAVIAPPLALGAGPQVAMLTVGLSGTLTGVFLAHLVSATGYLTLFAAGVLSSLDTAVEDEARTLGASRWQVWSRIMIPLLKRRLWEGLVLGGLVSWGQLAITLIVGGGLVRTLPIELLSIVRSGNDQLGAFAALALSVPPLLALGLLAAAARRTGASL
jgi:putative spermidine/putrescine transport system permease protein